MLSTGAKKRLRLLKLDKLDIKKRAKYDPNILGLDESSGEDLSSDSEDIDDDPEVVENNIKVIENDPVVESADIQTEADIVTITDDIGSKVQKNDDLKMDTEKTPNETPVKKETKTLLEHPTQHVEVKRDPKIQVARLKLPILGEEQRIMELINENEFLIVAGETGG